jgi:2-polyprenyl-3-methyl-5-hydroxy-6-metoxy-1,4-benzoquinol methylase
MIYESVNIPLWRNLRNLSGLRMLDVGCGTGAVGELLQRNGNLVDGITHSEEEVEVATKRLHKVYFLDLNDHATIRSQITETYDVLIFAGVLEHLVHPVESLRVFTDNLRRDQSVYISLPNIACFYVRLGLLMGRFDPLVEGGILDKTHLHHYTLKTAKQMIAEAGLKIETMDFMPGVSVWIYQTFFKKTSLPPDGNMAARKDFQFYERFVYPVEHCLAYLWKPMFANEFQFLCRKSGE